ncbi:hypothetical protein [Planotetraspora sp. GP83]|uniref:hypothetical protein n=1 Tax=Planotetraspora sp. GP83 TaxID=3156264 RepID=UPI003518761A
MSHTAIPLALTGGLGRDGEVLALLAELDGLAKRLSSDDRLHIRALSAQHGCDLSFLPR